MTDIVDSNIALLHQGLELLEHVTDPAYREVAPGKSSVGAQYRHVLDHYRALLEGITTARVDYDARRRNPDVETNRTVAERDTRDLIERLTAAANRPLGTPLSVIAACSADNPGTPQPSSLGRELLFLVSHTIHHYAIIRLLLENPDVVAPGFGTAPSTLAWQRTAS